MEMRTSEPLYGLTYTQDTDLPKFGTDSLLLGDFCPPVRGDMADLGAGCGILSLLLLRKYPGRLHAVELDPAAAAIAAENFINNGFADRACVFAGDLRCAEKLPPAGSCELVVANPPYFDPAAGPASPDAARRCARSEESCTLSDICRAARRILRFRGRLCLCWRPDRAAELFAALAETGFAPKRLRLCHPRVDREANLLLCEARSGAAPGLCVMPPLILAETDGSPTAEYRRIYEI